MFSSWIIVRPRQTALAGLIAGSLCLAGGCASHGGILGVDCCADIPAGAVPEPAGTKVCNWQTAQVTSAISDQTVLYQADFVGKSTELSPGATNRMACNASSGLASLQPTVIEPSGNASLDAERVNAVHAQLAVFDAVGAMVKVATPAAHGLRGPMAEQAAGALAGNQDSGSGVGAPIAGSFGQGGGGGNLPGGIF